MLSSLRARAPAHVERTALTVCVSILAGAAWLALWISDGGSLLHLHHMNLETIESSSFLAGFVLSWTVMTVAMMLPASLPVLAILDRFAAARRDRWLVLGLAAAGYLLVWAMAGVLAYGGYRAWNTLMDSRLWIAQHAPAGAPLLLLLAGAFQFSSLKYRCLDRCRSPFSFVVAHWQGHGERRQSFVLGMEHGLFCVGCCWALMLLMFAVGVGSLVWMFILAVLMAVEKNVSWGRRLSVPLGITLLAWGMILLVST